MAASNLQIDYNALAAAIIAAQAEPGVSFGAKVSGGGRGAVDAVVEEGAVKAGNRLGGIGCGPEVELGVHVKPGSIIGSSDEDAGAVSDSVSVVSGGSVGVVTQKVRENVRFGDVSGGSNGSVPGTGDKKFYATVVRSGNVLRFKAVLEQLMGEKVPKSAMLDLAVCTFASGVMPVAIVKGKQRLKMLAAIGDASITLHLVTAMAAKGQDVESAQAARSRLTSNAGFREVMRRQGWLQFVSYPAGVDPVTTGGTSTAFEAVIGTLTLCKSPGVVGALLERIKAI